jgi:hypothetical protein
MTKLNKAKLINKFNIVVNPTMVNWPKIDLSF